MSSKIYKKKMPSISQLVYKSKKERKRPLPVPVTIVRNEGSTSVSKTPMLDDFELSLRLSNSMAPLEEVTLSHDELNREYVLVLKDDNPQKPSNIVEYNYKDKCFVHVPPAGNTVELMHMDQFCFHKDSAEASMSRSSKDSSPSRLKERLLKKSIQKLLNEGDEMKLITEEEVIDIQNFDKVIFNDETENIEVGKIKTLESIEINWGKKLHNRFNFSDRSVNTTNNSYRDFQLQTDPQPRATFSSQITQWIIFDCYAKDFEEKQKLKDAERLEREEYIEMVFAKFLSKSETNKSKHKSDLSEIALSVTKTMERIVNQNLYNEIAFDCRYWEDPNDEFQEKGTLLPLWKFSYEKTKQYMVTSLCWNPVYYDLFVVTFGSFNFRAQPTKGAICLFTLKNPSFPEYIFFSNIGVMCADVNPMYPNLCAVGLYDGHVAVYDVSYPVKEPLYKSNMKNRKHSSVVCQVTWALGSDEDLKTFYSIGGDGCVLNWTLASNVLTVTKIILLDMPLPPVAGPNGTFVKLLATGSSITLHPTEPHIFLAGTREGAIYKCCANYCSTPLKVHHSAHTMAVNRLDYNKYNNDIFVSCSADWRVKIWDETQSESIFVCIFVFELSSSVVDVKWSPYSSTVFAAVTSNCRVFVYDINVNILEAICEQVVGSHKKDHKLTSVAFNNKLPVVIVGNDKGGICSFKMSPNMRKKVKPPKKGVPFTYSNLEKTKLNTILLTIREPHTLTTPDSSILKTTKKTKWT